MTTGTKSILFGAHTWFIHPFFVAWAWTKLYGFPWSLKLWIAFVVHDWGYWGKSRMDDEIGETHPILGARIMSFLFDFGERGLGPGYDMSDPINYIAVKDPTSGRTHIFGRWGQFALLHSRYFAKKLNQPFSRLCVADKLAIALTPAWLYLPGVSATGEIHEYLKNAQNAEAAYWKPTGYDKRKWYAELQRYMIEWVDAHKDGQQDTWTNANRHTRTTSGVWE